MSEIETRELNVDDVFAVAKMLGKITKGARLQLAAALAGDYTGVVDEVVGVGDGVEKGFALVHRPIQVNTESISIDKMVQVSPKNYSINYATGELLFNIAPKGAKVISASYTGKISNPTEVGLVLFQSVFLEAGEDLKEWLATLTGKEVAEFSKLPATAVLDVIEKLAEQEGIRDFFGKASLLATKFTGKG